MHSLVGRVFDNLSGEWRLNLENRVPRHELYQARIASSKPSLGFFVLLLCSAVIATLGLIANSTAVVIGAMIVAPLMDPILSLAFGFTLGDNRLAKRSAITVVLGSASVVGTAWLLATIIGPGEINAEITSRAAPNLIDLGIAVAAAVAGAFTITRERLANSIAGVAIAVALVPPLCVCGIGLSQGPELVAVFGRGTVAGLTNEISEGSFLLFLANLIGITLASLVVFMVQRYGSLRTAWRHLLAWLGLMGVLCIPLASALQDFSVQQKINRQFGRFKAGLLNNTAVSRDHAYFLKRIRLLYSNVQVEANAAVIDLVINVPNQLVDELQLQNIHSDLAEQTKELYDVDAVTINISLIPTQIYRYNLETGRQP